MKGPVVIHRSDEAGARARSVLALAAAVCLPLLALQTATSADNPGGYNTGTRDAAAARAVALAAVQNPDGSPRSGHDPTQLRQITLAEAARQPDGLAAGEHLPSEAVPSRTGVGPNGDAVNRGTHVPARDVAMGKPPVKPEEVLPGDGLLVNGCVAGYGQGGACLPSAPRRAAAQAVTKYRWKCTEVRELLPLGIAVDGHDGHDGHVGHQAALVDPLALDSNGDGIACGRGDR